MQNAAADYGDTWLIIPLYNEEKVIGEVVCDAKKTFQNIVCVDDGSTDGSVKAALASGATVVQHPMNLGQGAALQTGIDFALRQPRMKYLVTFDADGQHDIADATAMVDRARRDNLAFVFGSRFLGGESPVGWSKEAVLKTAAAATRWKTGLKITDAHNGLRLLRRDAAEQVHLHHDRMAHASEIIGQLARTNLPWAEQPVTITYTDYSKSKGQSILNSVNILVDLIMG